MAELKIEVDRMNNEHKNLKEDLEGRRIIEQVLRNDILRLTNSREADQAVLQDYKIKFERENQTNRSLIEKIELLESEVSLKSEEIKRMLK